MRLIEWAFEQDIGHPEKIVLVWLAWHANSAGVGAVDRDALERATGYKKRSMQRLLKSLRDSQHLVEHGIWYGIGNAGFGKIVKPEELAQLPDKPVPMGDRMVMPAIDADAIGETIAMHVTDAAEYLADQLQNFEARFATQIERVAMLHVEHIPPAPPPDPVLENPLFGQLLESGMGEERAYKLAQADLEMGNELETDAAPGAANGDYGDDPSGRYERILDILHGSNAAEGDVALARGNWTRLEVAENKHTKKGETDAFALVYPAIVAAAKANVGKLSISDFIGPHVDGDAPWDKELYPIDKDAPELMTEIATMLVELEATNDPRCQVQGRTKEIGDDGVTRYETVLGYHRRVTGKHNEMLRLKNMGVIE